MTARELAEDAVSHSENIYAFNYKNQNFKGMKTKRQCIVENVESAINAFALSAIKATLKEIHEIALDYGSVTESTIRLRKPEEILARINENHS